MWKGQLGRGRYWRHPPWPCSLRKMCLGILGVSQAKVDHQQNPMSAECPHLNQRCRRPFVTDHWPVKPIVFRGLWGHSHHNSALHLHHAHLRDSFSMVPLVLSSWRKWQKVSEMNASDVLNLRIATDAPLLPPSAATHFPSHSFIKLDRS
jgi:hypothetical protein